MQSNQAGIFVKNTFLEISEGDELPRLDTKFWRHVSEPADVYMTWQVCDQQASCWQLKSPEKSAELDADSDNLSTAGINTPTRFDRAYSSTSASSLGSSPRMRQHSNGYVQQLALDALIESKDPIKTNEQEVPLGDLPAIHTGAKLSPPDLGAYPVTVRNMPPEYTRQMMIMELWNTGFHEHRDFDLLYLPTYAKSNSNIGHCFINFNSSSTMNAFITAFDDRPLQGSLPTMLLRVSPSTAADILTIYSTEVVEAPASAPTPCPMPPVQGLPRRPKFCPQCGEPIQPCNFCGYCGTSLRSLLR